MLAKSQSVYIHLKLIVMPPTLKKFEVVCVCVWALGWGGGGGGGVGGEHIAFGFFVYLFIWLAQWLSW